MPGIRKVVTRSPHRRVGLVACPWFRSTAIEYESLLERDFVRLAVLDLKNSSISEQPFTMDLGKFGHYTPDFLLTRTDGKTVVEVKPKEHASSEKHRLRLGHAAHLLANEGYRFLVATEIYIRDDKLHERASILLRHARSRLPLETTTRLLTLASSHPEGIAIGELAYVGGVPTSAVLNLIGRRQLYINSSLRFDASDFVYPIGGNNGCLHT